MIVLFWGCGTEARPPQVVEAGATDPDTRTDSGNDAGTEPGTEPDTDPTAELRGVWVDRWTFADADDVRQIMEEAADAGFNTVFFQVRGTADAYYSSTWEPWAERLSGTLGQDPGWDPLQEAIDAGHARGLEVHAYLNAFPLWSGTTPPTESTPRHAWLEHPDWLCADADGVPMALNSSYVWMSPGHPEARERLANVAEDIASRYDVDGIHLDLIRYPGAEYCHDATSEALYDGSGWEDWQRAQVVEAVAGVYAVSPVPVTAAVWGVYTNDWGWSSVSEGYSDYYQDPRAFAAEGVIDANIPMIYWEVTDPPGERLDFATLIADHVAHANGRHVYAGISADLGEEGAVACVEAAREAGARGVVVFDWGLMHDGGWMRPFGERVFTEPAAVPSYPWR